MNKEIGAAAAAPLIEPSYAVALDPGYAGAWLVAGDLDGEGQVDAEGAIVQVGDMDGDGVPDLLFHTLRGAYVFLSQGEQRTEAPPGRGSNVTLY